MWLGRPFVTAMKGGGMRRVQGLVWLGGATLVSQARVGPKRLTDSQSPTLAHTSPQTKTLFAVADQVCQFARHSFPLSHPPRFSLSPSGCCRRQAEERPSALLQSQLFRQMWRSPVTPLTQPCPLAAGGRRREHRLPGGRFGGHRIYKALTFPTPLSLKCCSTTFDD